MNYIEMFCELSTNNENTKTAYHTDLKQMAEYIGKDVLDIDEFDMVSYKKYIEQFSSASRARKLGVVKRFFEFLKENNKIDTNPAHLLKAPKVVNKTEETLSRDEVKAMIAASKNKRDAAIITTLAQTGMRVSELINIKVDDIDENHNVEILGKGSKRRTIHFNDTVMTAINNYLAVRKNGCDFLFVSNQGTQMSPRALNNTLKVIGKRVGVENAHNHALRHYYATELLDSGVPITSIASSMGHSSCMVTERYARIRDKVAVATELMEMELV